MDDIKLKLIRDADAMYQRGHRDCLKNLIYSLEEIKAGFTKREIIDLLKGALSLMESMEKDDGR